MKDILSFHKVLSQSTKFALIIFFSLVEVWAQMPSVYVPATEEAELTEDYTWWYAALFILALGLIGAVFWRTNVKKALKNVPDKGKKKAVAARNAAGSPDARKEPEGQRKNLRMVSGNGNKTRNIGSKSSPNNLNGSRNKFNAPNKIVEDSEVSSADLPVFSILKIQPARPYPALPISNDEALMSAIEQTHEELEDDETIRELSVRILMAFKTRNSVEALSQVALYDLSSNLRSKAVTVLSDFDHESVFETILLACADPTREVKAAAARALFRVTFDRANAWTRVAEAEEEGRMRQIARAAIEADLVERSLDRLVHGDHKIAQEAVAFTNLMIKSGETKEVFKALVGHKKPNVRKAILHVIKITKDQKALEGLYSLLEQNNLPLELQEEVDKTIEEIGFVTA